MATLVQDAPFYAPSTIVYLDADGVEIPASNVVAYQIDIHWAGQVQRVTFNASGQPITASTSVPGITP